MNDCPKGFDLVQMGYDKRCLKWETSSRPWIEAENKCQSLGGNLVHIMNEQEQKDFNQWHIGKVHNKDDDWMNDKWAGSWIGLTDIYSGLVIKLMMIGGALEPIESLDRSAIKLILLFRVKSNGMEP